MKVLIALCLILGYCSAKAILPTYANTFPYPSVRLPLTNSYPLNTQYYYPSVYYTSTVTAPKVLPNKAIRVDDEDVDVVEADETPIEPSGPVTIRRIFPVFSSDLRGGSSFSGFLRPDQVRPIKPDDSEEDDVKEITPVQTRRRIYLYKQPFTLY